MSFNKIYWSGDIRRNSMHFNTSRQVVDNYCEGPIVQILFPIAFVQQEDGSREMGALSYDATREGGAHREPWYTTVRTRNGPRREGIPRNARIVVRFADLELRINQRPTGWWVGVNNDMPRFFADYMFCTKDDHTDLVNCIQFGGFARGSREKAENLFARLAME